MANEPTTSTPRLAEIAVVQMNEAIKHADRLKEILTASLDAAPALSGEAIRDAISEKTGMNPSALRAIFSALDNLNTLKNDNGGSTDDAINSVVATFGKDHFPGLEEVREKIREAVESYTDDNPVAISLKASRLSYLYEKLYIEAEIVTDARPVYNSDASAILEFVVNHCLLLTYHEDSGVGTAHNHPRLHVALDFDDILALREVCDRAIKKGITLKTELGKKARVLGDDG